MWLYIGRNAAKIARDPDRPPTRLKSAAFMVGLGGYAIGAVVAIFSPGAAVTVYGLVAIYYLFEHQPRQPATPDPHAEVSAATGQGLKALARRAQTARCPTASGRSVASRAFG